MSDNNFLPPAQKDSKNPTNTSANPCVKPRRVIHCPKRYRTSPTSSGNPTKSCESNLEASEQLAPSSTDTPFLTDVEISGSEEDSEDETDGHRNLQISETKDRYIAQDRLGDDNSHDDTDDDPSDHHLKR